MPFKKIVSPRRVAGLEGGATASTQLKSAGYVSMVSSDPGGLAVVPQSGNPRITGVSLNELRDVALISRDVAVVRSEGDIWALLDIGHTPKMDQVARDQKLLAGTPSGGTALSIGWDGRATTYAFGNNEVTAREFALRGDVRSAFCTDKLCYVVIDGTGGEGGELRVHPGATPEPGAQGRAPLPKGASNLDCLAAGPDLVVLYKPGETKICAVIGQGSRFEAKMVEIDAAVTAAAVAETSVLVATAEGRLRLFDRAALSDASGTLQETDSAMVGDGSVDTIEVAGRGSATAWLGTSGGGIFSAALMRKQALV